MSTLCEHLRKSCNLTGKSIGSCRKSTKLKSAGNQVVLSPCIYFLNLGHSHLKFTGISCRSQGMGGGHVCGHPEGVTGDYTGHLRDNFLDKSLVEVILGPGQSVRKYFQKFTGCASCSCYKEGEFYHLVRWDLSIIRAAESPAWGGYWKNRWGR